MSAAPSPTRFAINVDQFQRMDCAGVFRDTPRIELIDGDLLTMSPVGSPHAFVVDRLLRLLLPLEQRGFAWISCQRSMRLSRHSAPQPDLLLLRPPASRYATALPAPEDTLCLIEVAETSLQYDLGQKLDLYARHGMAEVWVIDVEGKRLLTFWRSEHDRFVGTRTLDRSESVSCQAIPEMSIRWGLCFGE